MSKSRQVVRVRGLWFIFGFIAPAFHLDARRRVYALTEHAWSGLDTNGASDKLGAPSTSYPTPRIPNSSSCMHK